MTSHLSLMPNGSVHLRARPSPQPSPLATLINLMQYHSELFSTADYIQCRWDTCDIILRDHREIEYTYFEKQARKAEVKEDRKRWIKSFTLVTGRQRDVEKQTVQ